jgi:hypothetical protein
MVRTAALVGRETPARRPWSRALCRLLLAAPLLFTPSSCVTASLFDNLPRDGHHVDWHDGGTYGMLALTPLTVGLDVALIGAVAYLNSAGDDDCSCDRPRHHHCR